MRRALVFVSLCGCSPSAPRTEVPAVAPPPPEVAASFGTFEPLFEEGAVARYAWHTEQVSDAPEHPEPHGSEMLLVCTAGKVQRWGDLRMITWGCRNGSAAHAVDDPRVGGTELSPTWVASPVGLWRPTMHAWAPKTEAEARALLAEQIVLPATPVADKQRNVLEAAGEDGTPATVLVTEYRAEGDQGVWCRDQRLETTMKGWAERLCFHPTRGLVDHYIEGREGHSTERLVRVERK